MSNPSPAAKVAMVTGAGRGVGRAIALALAGAGYRLALVARTREELETTRTLTGLAPKDSLIELADLALDNAPDLVMEATLEHYGRLDVLVNNAGWAPSHIPLARMKAADQDRVIALNLRAPVALTRLAAVHMVKQAEGGVIVNVASAGSRHPSAGEAVYAAAKSGLVAFTHAAFTELRGQKIRIAVILPGLTDTALIPPNKRLDRTRMLRPENVAIAVMSIVRAPPAVCPIELCLEPQLDPLRSGN